MAAREVDLTGRRYGRLIVLGHRGRSQNHTRLVAVKCDCGAECVMRVPHLQSGATRSCGCLRRELVDRRAKERRARAEEILRLGEKLCVQCGDVKPLSEFGVTAKSITRTKSKCTTCLAVLTADWNLRRKYGISAAEKQRMIDAQGGVCAIRGCETSVNIKSALDHCHESGQVRSVLCGRCNSALGMLGENIRRIEGIAEYARKWKQLILIRGGKTS